MGALPPLRLPLVAPQEHRACSAGLCSQPHTLSGGVLWGF